MILAILQRQGNKQWRKKNCDKKEEVVEPVIEKKLKKHI
jgi:hypothetical protein